MILKSIWWNEQNGLCTKWRDSNMENTVILVGQTSARVVAVENGKRDLA